MILLRTYELREIIIEECPDTRPNNFQLSIQALFLICIKYTVAASVIQDVPGGMCQTSGECFLSYNKLI